MPMEKGSLNSNAEIETLKKTDGFASLNLNRILKLVREQIMLNQFGRNGWLVGRFSLKWTIAILMASNCNFSLIGV